MTEQQNVAFLGLGAMGSRMASRLIDAGLAVTVWNRTPSVADALAQIGPELRQRRRPPPVALRSS